MNKFTEESRSLLRKCTEKESGSEKLKRVREKRIQMTSFENIREVHGKQDEKCTVRD